MTNEEIIEEILFEAGELGILNVVIDKAKELFDTNPKLDRVFVFQQALSESIKKNNE